MRLQFDLEQIGNSGIFCKITVEIAGGDDNRIRIAQVAMELHDGERRRIGKPDMRGIEDNVPVDLLFLGGLLEQGIEVGRIDALYRQADDQFMGLGQLEAYIAQTILQILDQHQAAMLGFKEFGNVQVVGRWTDFLAKVGPQMAHQLAPRWKARAK